MLQKKMEANKNRLHSITNRVHTLSREHGYAMESENLLRKRQEEAVCALKRFGVVNGEKDKTNIHEDSLPSSSAVLLGINYGAKNSVRPIKLPEVPKLPPYTTWIFLDRYYCNTKKLSGIHVVHCPHSFSVIYFLCQPLCIFKNYLLFNVKKTNINVFKKLRLEQ